MNKSSQSFASADLHFHTTHSDGKHSLDWVVAQLDLARQSGLKLAVLTDHDGVPGFSAYAEAVKNWWKPICASELSCTWFDAVRQKEIELHLLVYGIDPDNAEIVAQFNRFKEERRQRFIRISERLQEAGYKIETAKLLEEHKGSIGRPHVADALIAAGYAKDRADAFDRFLKDGTRFTVKKWRFPLEDAVAFAKKSGCRTSIAHPGQYGFKKETLQIWKELGVDAIEVIHPRHTEADRAYYRTVAKDLGFLTSGGSDFHAVESDHLGELPSLGRTQYRIEDAENFLGPLLS